MTRGSARYLAILACMTFVIAAVATPDERAAVTVATVQFRVTEEAYSSVAAYRDTVEEIVERAVNDHSADIVVFPEYLNVFLVAARFPRVVESASTIEEALRLIAAEQVGRDPSGERGQYTNLSALLSSAAEEASAQAIVLWKRLAATHEVTIVAGTFFVPADSPHERGLRNRLIVFDETGAVVYEQDKVYLTEEERRDLGIRPGNLDAAEPVELTGITVGFTICRDTFFDTWHDRLDGSELWIDLRANGEPFTPEVRRRFDRTLPDRVREGGAVAGVNATLTGSFLDLMWEGRSYSVDDSGARIAESRRVVGTEITTVEFVPCGESWRLRSR